MQLIPAQKRRVIRWTNTLSSMRKGDALVFPKTPGGWKGVYRTADKLGIKVMASAVRGEPAMVVRL